VPDILKTWPATMSRRHVLRAFTHDWGGSFYFTLGRGKPTQQIDHLFFTHRGQIIGSFKADHIIRNDGTNIPPLRSISGEVSEWQIKPDAYVAVCSPPFRQLEEKIYHEGFRGWRYFSLEEWRTNIDSQVRI
jgi:hypothetical protein